MAAKPVTPQFQEFNEWEMFGFALEKTKHNVLVRGIAGTGKNQRIIRTFKKLGIEHGIFNMTAQSSKEDAYGHFVPNKTGGMNWIYNAASNCAMKGIPLLINEIDKCVMNGESQDILQTICESFGSWEIMLPDGENTVIRPKEGFRVIAVMNGNWDDLPTPILSRFPIKIDLGVKVDPEALEKLPQYARGLCDMMENNNGVFSLRSIFSFVEAIKLGVDPRTAGYLYFGKEHGHAIADAVLLDLSRGELDRQVSAV
jgi:hypothetical protein